MSKRALGPYKSGPSKFWLKTKNVVESELLLLGTDYDNEGKPIAYLGRAVGRRGQDIRFAGTAFLTSAKAAAVVPKVRQPEWGETEHPSARPTSERAETR